MGEFKVGDRVRFKDARYAEDWRDAGEHEAWAGLIYEVVEDAGFYCFSRANVDIDLVNNNNDEFELVEEAEKEFKYKAGTYIEITTDIHEYQGLMKGSYHRLEKDAEYAIFTVNGKLWRFTDDGQFKVAVPGKDFSGIFSQLIDKTMAEYKKPIKSDGGSSSYYDIELPEWLLHNIFERKSQGQAFIKTEELIDIIFDNDFDAANAFKSLVRAWGSFNGAGKEGNDVGYEVNKIKYSADKLKQRFERKEEKL